MRKRILQLLLLMAFIPCGQAQSLDDLVKASSSITTLQAHFTQVKQSSMLADPIEMQGYIWFDNPKALRWEYVKPTQQVMIVNGDSITMRNGDQANTASLSSNRVAKHLMPMIMNLMSGKSLTDHRMFNINSTQNGQEVVVEMIPTKKQMQRMFAKIVLHFDSTTRLLNSVVLEEKADTKTVIRFDKVSINQPLPTDIFNINTPRP